MATKYIDIESCEVEIGSVGFLVEVCPQGKASSYHLRTRPLRRNMSGEPILRGWGGETNNVNRAALGLARAIVVSPNDRVAIEYLAADSPEERAALETLCYPELAS